jgi:lysophospholipase L1-like esterase
VGPRFIGRFDLSNVDTPVFAWSGTAISLRFTGSAISVTLSDSGSNWFEVVLDGQHTQLGTQPGKQTYPLARGLADGAHDLLLYRRSEAFFGETTFYGFDLAPSAFLAGAPVLTRRLEVIGDSISAGYGNEGVFPCQFAAKTENHWLSYGALAARTARAELFSEAWSGIGMLRNNGGDTTGTMPERYPRTLPERSASAWDFSTFQPNAVLINLGTNDFVTGDPGAAFRTTYTQFVTDLRGQYPRARFFLGVGPMLGGQQYTQASAYLNGVIADRQAAGDANLSLLEFGTQALASDQVGCDYHPSLKTHQKMADQLLAALRADLGW